MALAYDKVRSDYGETIGTDLTTLVKEQRASRRLDLLNPNKAVFMVFMKAAMLKEPVVGDLTFKYDEDEQVETIIRLTADHTSSAQTITVSDGSVLSPWMTLRNVDKDLSYQVVAVTGNSVTVQINSDNGTAVAGSANDQLVVTGPALEEGTGIPTAHWTTPNQYTNYVENTMEPVSLDWHALNADLHYGPREPYEYAKAAVRHNERLDLKLMFNGAPYKLASTDADAASGSAFTLPSPKGNALSFTMGFWYWQNLYSDTEHHQTVPSLSEFKAIDLLEAAFSAERGGGRNRKLWLAPRNAGSGILKWNIGRTRFTNVKDADMPVGLKFTRMEAANLGTVDLVRYDPFYHRSGGYHRFAIIDPDRIGYTFYKGMNTKTYRDQIQTGDQVKAGYVFSSIGSIFKHANCHATCKFAAIA